MGRALDKALRRGSKVLTYLQHTKPSGDLDEAGRWALAVNAAKTVNHYLERQRSKSEISDKPKS